MAGRLVRFHRKRIVPSGNSNQPHSQVPCCSSPVQLAVSPFFPICFLLSLPSPRDGLPASSMWFGVDGHDSLPVNVSSLRPFEELVHYHAVNAVLGSLCTLINSLLLAVFLSTPKFRNRYVVSLAGPYLDGQGKVAKLASAFQNKENIPATDTTMRGRPDKQCEHCNDRPQPDRPLLDGHRDTTRPCQFPPPPPSKLPLLQVRTSAECAAETWLLFHLVGDLLIPVTIFWMGIERFTAIK